MNRRGMQGVLLANLAATLYMTGLIWFVQLVHYPLFAAVGEVHFAEYERAHRAATFWAVAPAMLVEGVTAATAVWGVQSGSERRWLWFGLALVAGIWCSTVLVQIPRHDLLARGFDAATVQELVVTNWLRTIAWTTRSGMMLILVGRRLQSAGC